MNFVIVPAQAPLRGAVDIPGDKSIGHRALLFSALSATPVRVRGLGDGADNGRSAKAITALGARIERDGDVIVIHGVGLDGMTAPRDAIDCGNSGTTIRLLAGMLAGQRFATSLFGDESLSKRPMARVIDPLVRMGALISGVGEPPTPPLTIGPARGPVVAIDFATPIASAQVKTAVLLAGLYADGVTAVTEPGPSRDHSERMLAHLGAPLVVRGRRTELDTRGWDRRLAASGFDVPADPSSAAFLVAAALLAGPPGKLGEVKLPGVCLNPTRTGFLDVIAAMGARVAIENERSAGPEPIGDIVVRGPQPLVATAIGGDLAVRSIDELPILAVLAARARGVTVVRDAEELRVKESDRVATTCAMLRSFGIRCEEHPDGFTVHGVPDGPWKPGAVDAAGDHRIAMAGAVAALIAGDASHVADAGNVATSYPGFAAALGALGATVTVR